MRQSFRRGLLALALVLMFGLLGWLAKGYSGAKANEAPGETALPATMKTCPLHEHQAAAPSGKPYRFVALGDWGAGTPFQKDVARQINGLYAQEPLDAVLMLGDNIYEDGNVKAHGQAYFTEMYAPVIQGGADFIVALGNHDVKGGYQDDQVRFFKMPGYYYTVARGPVAFFVIDSNTFHKDEVQQKWLAQALGRSDAKWKIVMGHHPIYSSGEHGNRPALKKTLEPILARGQANFYLAGHDHDYERFAPIQGVTHIVSGGGGAYLRDFEKPVAHSQVRIKAHHFLSFEQQGCMLTLKVIDKTGQVVDTTQWCRGEMDQHKAKQAS